MKVRKVRVIRIVVDVECDIVVQSGRQIGV